MRSPGCRRHTCESCCANPGGTMEPSILTVLLLMICDGSMKLRGNSCKTSIYRRFPLSMQHTHTHSMWIVIQCVSCRLQCVSCRLQCVSCRLQCVSCRLQCVSCRLQCVSCRLQCVLSFIRYFLFSMLSALTRQVEASSREVSQLQVRVDHAHSQGLEERELSVRTQEEHFKSTASLYFIRFQSSLYTAFLCVYM